MLKKKKKTIKEGTHGLGQLDVRQTMFGRREAPEEDTKDTTVGHAEREAEAICRAWGVQTVPRPAELSSGTD